MAKAKPKKPRRKAKSKIVAKPTLISVRACLRREHKWYSDAAKRAKNQATTPYFEYMAEFLALLLENGELFTERMPADRYWTKRKKAQPRQCFYNAQTLCIEADLPYYEGYYFGNKMLFQHAFNVLDGKVIDVTRDAIDRKLGPTKGFWYGAPVSQMALCRRQAKTGQCSPALLPDAAVFDD